MTSHLHKTLYFSKKSYRDSFSFCVFLAAKIHDDDDGDDDDGDDDGDDIVFLAAKIHDDDDGGDDGDDDGDDDDDNIVPEAVNANGQLR